MAHYSAIKAAVNAYIKQNGRKEITGRILNAVLNATIDSLGRFYQFAGEAFPTSDPGTPDQNVTYLAGTAGTYTNFGGITLDTQEIALLMWDGEWKKQTMLFGIKEVNASVDNQVGTPSVDVEFLNNVLTLVFHNIKGDKGDTGDAAGFGQVTASVDDTYGNPSVQVQTSGDNTSKNIAFEFHGLRGPAGITSVVVSVDNTSGTPSCDVSLVGQVLHLDFSGLKGLKGDTGVSADFPITIYNGLDSDATDQALAAAQGKFLDEEIKKKLDSKLDSDALYITDLNGNIIAKIDASGVSSYDVCVLIDGELVSVKDLLQSLVTGLENEQTRAEEEEAKKLDRELDDDTLRIVDINGYIIAKIDANGIHSAKDKNEVACMVLAEYYYPTTAPTRDSNGNVTHASVMFGTGVSGSLDISYSGNNASEVIVHYGSHSYIMSIIRDTNGNVERVTIN